MIEMSLEFKYPQGNELLLPSTVEWFLINNDSAILRLIVLHDWSPMNDLSLNDQQPLNVVFDYDSCLMIS